MSPPGPWAGHKGPRGHKPPSAAGEDFSARPGGHQEQTPWGGRGPPMPGAKPDARAPPQRHQVPPRPGTEPPSSPRCHVLPPRLRGPFCPPTPAQGGEPQFLWRARGPSPKLPPQPHAGGTAVHWGGGGGLRVLGQGGGQERGDPRLQEQQHKGEAARAPAQRVRDPPAPSAHNGAAPSPPSPSPLCPAPGTGVPGCEPCPPLDHPPAQHTGTGLWLSSFGFVFGFFYGLQNSS